MAKLTYCLDINSNEYDTDPKPKRHNHKNFLLIMRHIEYQTMIGKTCTTVTYLNMPDTTYTAIPKNAPEIIRTKIGILNLLANLILHSE